MFRPDMRRCAYSSPSEGLVMAGAVLPEGYEFNRPFREIMCHAPARGCSSTPAPCQYLTAQQECETYTSDPGKLLGAWSAQDHRVEVRHASTLIATTLVVLLDDEPIFSHSDGLFYGLSDLSAATTLAQKMAQLVIDEFGTAHETPIQSSTISYFEELLS